MTELSKEADELVAFAYELRKQDVNDKYTYDFLNGQVKPSILVDIIMSNRWNEDAFEMQVQKGTSFRINIGQNSALQFKK